jgi:hypothetical protein
MALDNLGNTLRALGERESGTARLEEAVATWDNCFEITPSIWRQLRLRARQDEARAEIERRSAK